MTARPRRDAAAWAAGRAHFGVLLAILAFAFALRVAFAPGLSGNDDMALAGDAIDILRHGLRVPQEHYAARLGITLPLAGLFRVFGVGVPQLVVLPMAMSLLGIALAWRIGAVLFEPAVGLLGAAVLALYPLDVEYAGICFPDNAQGTALAGAFALALQCRRGGRGRGYGMAVLAGICWAYGYYVKIDSFFMAFVFLLATLLGYIRVRHLLTIGATTGVLVGCELVFYAVVLGDPFHHAALERIATNEVLAAGMDYHNMFTLPKAMFLTVYETGIAFYLVLAGMALAVVRRSRPGLMLAGWVLIFYLWLSFGVDPFGGGLRLKPQLTRYLVMFAIPMSVLIGWLLVETYRRLSRWLAILVCAGGAVLALLFVQFNLLNYEAARATRVALDRAVREHWFPLYADQQSLGMIDLLLYGRVDAGRVKPAQHHDYLTGETTFPPIPGPHAYLLVNEDFARRLQTRSLVTPIDPGQFGLTPTKVLSVDNPLPASSYAILRLMDRVAGLLPLASVRQHIAETTADVERPGDAKIYRLDAATR